MISDNLLQAYKDTLIEEIRADEKKKAEAAVIHKLEMNDLHVFVEHFETIGPQGKGTTYKLIVNINREMYNCEFNVTQLESLSLNGDVINRKFREAIVGFVSESILKGAILDLGRYK